MRRLFWRQLSKLAPRSAKPVLEPKPKRVAQRLATRGRRPIEGAPTLWRGRWADHHQRDDDG